MAEISREIMSRMDKLDICEHDKERQDCPKCRKPSAFEQFTIRLDDLKKTEEMLASRSKK